MPNVATIDGTTSTAFPSTGAGMPDRPRRYRMYSRDARKCMTRGLSFAVSSRIAGIGCEVQLDWNVPPAVARYRRPEQHAPYGTLSTGVGNHHVRWRAANARTFSRFPHNCMLDERRVPFLLPLSRSKRTMRRLPPPFATSSIANSLFDRAPHEALDQPGR
jgi:hypothetical protein